MGREPFRKRSPGDRLTKPPVTSASYGFPLDYLIFGAAALFAAERATHFTKTKQRRRIPAKAGYSGNAAVSAPNKTAALKVLPHDAIVSD